MGPGRLCCTYRVLSGLPLSQTGSAYGLCDGYAKNGVTVVQRDLDLELSDLSVKISGDEALAEEFDAVHLRLCAALA